MGDGDRLLSMFCSLPAPMVHAQERHAKWMPMLRERTSNSVGTSGCAGSSSGPSGSPGALRGRALFESLEVGHDVVYRVTQELPKGSKRGKRAAIKWAKSHIRWARAKVVRVAHDHLVVKDKGTGKEAWLSVLDVNNRLLRDDGL